MPRLRSQLKSAIPFLICCSLAAADDRAERLIEAARLGNIGAVRKLLSDGADVNARGRFDITPAWQAAKKRASASDCMGPSMRLTTSRNMPGG